MLFFLKNRTVLIILSGLIASFLIGYPAIYLTDEWISGSQIFHLSQGNIPLSGYEKYGSIDYIANHDDVLSYTYAYPILSLPALIGVIIFGNFFRSVILFSLYFLAIILIYRIIEINKPRLGEYSKYYVYAAGICLTFLLVLNLLLVTPFDVEKYPEILALVLTNSIFFGVVCGLVYLIFKNIFSSEYWGIFGFILLLTSTSYLFWSGNAKDHMSSLLFITIAAYFFILFIQSRSYLHLVSSFISIGLLAFVRPELGLWTFLAFFLAALIISSRQKWSGIGKTLMCSPAVAFGAIPLFINNFGVTGNPLVSPLALAYLSDSESSTGMVSSRITTPFSSYFGDKSEFLTYLYRIFIDPVNPGAAGIFQVSPLSVFGILMILVCAFGLLSHQKKWHFSEKSQIFIFLLFWIFGIILAYIHSFPSLGVSLGIVPDIRYLCPVYIPLLLLCSFALKEVNFSQEEISTSLKVLLLLAIIDLPIIFCVYQYFWGKSQSTQLAFNMWMTYFFLLISIIVFFLIFLKKIDKKWLAYAIPPVMLSSLMWTLIVDFRFATLCWEGYHFWIPMVEWLWYIQYTIFPL